MHKSRNAHHFLNRKTTCSELYSDGQVDAKLGGACRCLVFPCSLKTMPPCLTSAQTAVAYCSLIGALYPTVHPRCEMVRPQSPVVDPQQ